jgi:hypothetical protein
MIEGAAKAPGQNGPRVSVGVDFAVGAVEENAEA